MAAVLVVTIENSQGPSEVFRSQD